MRTSLLILFLFISVIGCSKVLSDFPKVVPCTVTITDNGQPVSGAAVSINTVPPTPSLVVSAQTDEHGKAAMVTIFGNHAEPGVPIGKLVLTVIKEPEVPGRKSAEEIEQMGYDKSRVYLAEIERKRAQMPRIVPVELTHPDKSPITMETVGKPIDWQVKLEEYRK
jgi:hypothetical protein